MDPVYPDNQVESDVGYFYIYAKKGQTQKLTVAIQNISSNGISVGIEAADCYTSTGGDLCYITSNSNPLVSIGDERFMLAKYITLPYTNLPLKPGEAQTVTFTVKTPDINEGEVLGGIRFFVIQKGENSGSTSPENGAKLNLNVKRAMTITIRMRFNQPASMPSPASSVGDAGFMSEMGMMYFTMINHLPIINSDVKGSYRVFNAQGKLLFGEKFDLVRMAPKSEVRIPVKWHNQEVEPGNFKLEVVLGNESIAVPEIRMIQMGIEDIEIIGEETEPPAAAPKPVIAADDQFMIYGGWILFGVTFLFIIFFIIKRRRSGKANRNES